MKIKVAPGAALAMLTACGGGGGGSAPVAVVPGPLPSPTAAAPPAPVYATYTALTGDQRFRTGCGALRSDASPFAPRPAPPFGEALTLDYAAATQSYRVSEGGPIYLLGEPRLFGPTERDPAAPAPTISYARTINGFQERLSIGYPTTLGVAPDYVRGFSLRTPEGNDYRPGTIFLQYSCVFGVPTLATDLPPSGTYTRAAFNGAGYVVVPGSGAQQTYALAGSTIAVRIDRTAGTVTATLRLLGLLQTASGPATTPTDLGSYAVTMPIDARGGFSAQSDTNDPTRSTSVFGSGAFFGPQGVEAAMGIALYASEAGGRRISAVGNAVAQR